MKTKIELFILFVVCIGLMPGCGKKQEHIFSSLKDVDTVARLKLFVSEKESQARTAAEASGQTMPPETQKFFQAAERGDWLTVSNLFNSFAQNDNQSSDKTLPRLRKMPWEPMVRETWGALDAFSEGDAKYTVLYSKDVINSIPFGSIYFGGTDVGRFLITAMQKSQVNGNPFFTLTQNALADGSYLDYLRSMYGDKIYIPTPEELQKCFDDYSADEWKRLEYNQLKRGEDVSIDANGKVQVRGVVSMMTINGLLAKIIFDQNLGEEFYLQQSFPLDWMYSYLEPHGLILKINRQPMAEISADIIQSDHDYWAKTISPMIGNWLTDSASVADVVAFDEEVFGRRDFHGFSGDRRFIENRYASAAFAWDRSNIAGLYVWRMNHTGNSDEKERMAQAADFAFRQALALCPYNSDTVDNYQDFLKNRNRDADAALVNNMALNLGRPK
ncbi:MAG TPA: hypothetical protein VHG71_00455 [Verrucomicrobiae bacterium]|nr:hypothetical protein [Verrucomicrobiae bacterium]